MDCREFRDVIDSYLCGELLVETNHEILRHAEQCPACREEMAARRNLREALRRGGAQVRLSEEAKERIRQRLHEEAAHSLTAQSASDSLLRRNLAPRLALALAASLLLIAGYLYFAFRPAPPVRAAELSESVMEEAAREHDVCTFHYKDSPEPEAMKPRAVEFNPIFAGLDQVAKKHAQGMKLRLAHFCNLVGRNFVHLGFTQGDEMVSLLVTERDAKAMKNGIVPRDDGLRAGLQIALRGEYRVAAYQTSKHVVLVVSELPEAETKGLAESLAAPVSAHLRRLETATATPAATAAAR
ncbi:MAG: anti-sigma factor family protein [Blastocatellia bacterium]